MPSVAKKVKVACIDQAPISSRLHTPASLEASHLGYCCEVVSEVPVDFAT